MKPLPVDIHYLGRQPQPYRPIWQAMQRFTAERDAHSHDALWVLEHSPVFTQGRNGKAEHILAPGAIDVVPIDRGGQITYHGPGQLMVYTLLDIRRLGLGVRRLVTTLEASLIATLADYGISARGDQAAPGVYVDTAKIASLGLRVSRGRCFHGLALNVDMDLTPFARIHPCGYQNLAMTQIRDLIGPVSMAAVATSLCRQITHHLGLKPSQRPNTHPANLIQPDPS